MEVGACCGDAVAEIQRRVVGVGGSFVVAVAGGVETMVFVARVDIREGCLFLCLVLPALHLWISS